ncbi:unnamed protein product [Orchesella dallaii]|uniref:SID1 transmembrane family member 1 n=1 Tax=Orchesella dallaii TaxID=48710 RepID=A0ABP1REK6_9HEXA
MSNSKEYFQLCATLILVSLWTSLITPAECFLIRNKNMNLTMTEYSVDMPDIPSISTTIVRGETHIYFFTFSSSFLEKWPAYQLQFYAETDLAFLNQTSKRSYPLLVTAYWHGSIRSWEIPIYVPKDAQELRRGSRFSDNLVGKTFWDYPIDKQFDLWNLTVQICINNDATVFYKMKIATLPDFRVRHGLHVTGMATASAPSIYLFTPMLLAWQHLFIEVTSNTEICTLLSIQKLQGPFLDQMDRRMEMDYLETFTLKTALSLRGDKFPDGFLLVFYPFPDDTKCERLENHNGDWRTNVFRKKDMQFVIREGMPLSDYTLPLVFPIIVMLCCGYVTLLIQWRFNKERKLVLDGFKPFAPIVRRHSLFKSHITINDLVIEEHTRVAVQSKRYCRGVIVSTAFYCIPVFQLIRTFSDRLLETGDFDVCYFNHYCSHMLGSIHDFNHIYSNIGYLFFGLLYGLLVWRRQRVMCNPTTINQIEEQSSGCTCIPPHIGVCSQGNANAPNTPHRHGHGVCVHYSLLYCLGFTLFMTGIMSAGYHVCPSQSNFQFDTVFMYTIAAITVVTIYQFRHPTYLSANFTFIALAIVTCITVLGLLWEQSIVRISFTAIHSTFLISVLPKLCYNGYIRQNGRLVHHWHNMMHLLLLKLKDDILEGRLFKPQNVVWRAPHDPETLIIPGPGRLVLPGFFLLVNFFSLLAIWTVLGEQNFATQVLFVCVMNGSMYTLFYSFLKWCHGECRRNLWIQPCFYLISSLILWSVAMFYFFDVSSTWEHSPAESRLLNTDCLVMNFYDSHDMWHFLSSAALFCSAMVLLTVDDDLIDQPKSTIPVF